MPESGTKLSGIAAWAEAWRASDSANIAALGEQLAAAPDPDEIRRMALKWASSDARTEKFLGRTLLQNLADDAGDDEEKRLRSLVPWHVALNAGVVPTAQSGDFLVCLAAQSLSNVGFSLLMAHTRCPVQIVDVSEGQFWSAFSSLYISVVPAPLRDQLIAMGSAVPATDPTPALFPLTPEPAAAEPEDDTSIEVPAPAFVQTVWEAQDKPILDEEPIEAIEQAGLEDVPEVAEHGEPEVESEDEPEVAESDTEFIEDDPVIPLWNRFSIEEMRTLRACPIGESSDGVEFLVAAPAESTALARLSELVGGEARIRIVSLDDVNEAWRDQFGEDMIASPTTLPEPKWADESVEDEPEVAAPIEIEHDEEDLASLVADVEDDLETSESAVDPIAEEAAPEAESFVEAKEVAQLPQSGPDPAAVALVPSGLAWFARACPHRLEGETLVCWVQEPYDETLLSAIERRSGHPLRVEPMATADVMEALRHAYGQELAGVIEPLMPQASAPIAEPEVAAEPMLPPVLAEPVPLVSDAQPEAVEFAPEVSEEISEIQTEPEAITEVESVTPTALFDEDFESDFEDYEVVEEAVSEATEPAIVFAEPVETPEELVEQKSSLDQLLDDLALDPPMPPIDQDWRPRLAAPEPEFLAEEPEAEQKVEPTAETDVPVVEIEPDVEPTAEVETFEPAAEVETPQAGEAETPESETEVASSTEETVSASEVPIEPPAKVSKTDEEFTTEASEDARRAWDEFMATNGNRANRAEAQVDAVMGRLNREIALDEVAASAVEGNSSEDEDPNDDSPVTQESAAWTTEDVEEARIGQRHADSVQRLMGHSTLPGPEILEKVSREVAISNQIVPITIEEGTLHLIGSQPIAPIDVRELSNQIGMPLQLHLGTPEAVSRLITKAYPEPSGEDAVVHQMRLEEGRKQEDAAQQSWLDKLMNRVNKSG